MRKEQSGWAWFVLIAVLMAIGGCGGGGATSGSGQPVTNGDATSSGTSTSSSANSWLTFSYTPNLVILPDDKKTLSITANSSKTFAQTINVGIIDTKGVISPNATISSSSSGLTYYASVPINPSLSAGTYTGNLEVRFCYDSNPTVCNRPVDGSPWKLPYSFWVVDKNSMSFSGWEYKTYNWWDYKSGALPIGNNVAIASRGSTLVAVNDGVDTWVSSDTGSSWNQLQVVGPSTSTKGFALAGDENSVYLSGGQMTSSGSYASQVWKFDGSRWVQKTPSASFPGREGHMMVKVGSNLFVVGGTNKSGKLRDVWKSLDDGATWVKVLDTLPSSIGDVTCAVNWQNSLLIIGNGVMLTSQDGATWNTRQGFSDFISKFKLDYGALGSSRHCAVNNGRLFVANVGATASSADLASWQPDAYNVWLIHNDITTSDGTILKGFTAPGMVAVSGRLIVAHGLGTSQHGILRTYP
jgi:hypothetical protein